LERDAPFLKTSFVHLSKSSVYETLSRLQVPIGFKGAPMERLLSGTFVNLSSRVPSKGLPLETLSTEPLQRKRERERRSIPRASIIHLSKSLVDQPPSRFPN
jgi:hypothetical protein